MADDEDRAATLLQWLRGAFPALNTEIPTIAALADGRVLSECLLKIADGEVDGPPADTVGGFAALIRTYYSQGLGVDEDILNNIDLAAAGGGDPAPLCRPAPWSS